MPVRNQLARGSARRRKTSPIDNVVEPSFQKFLREEGASKVSSTDEAATYVRMICGVNTRAAFATNEVAAGKWRDIDTRFQTWLSGADL